MATLEIRIRIEQERSDFLDTRDQITDAIEAATGYKVVATIDGSLVLMDGMGRNGWDI